MPTSDVIPPAHDWQALEPLLPAKVPLGHEVHEVDDPLPYVPRGQGLHLEADAADTLIVNPARIAG